MTLMPDLTLRRRQPEIMDQPGLERHAHVQALRGLARINLWSCSARILWAELAALGRSGSAEPLRILDIATGGGDIPIRLARKARRSGLLWHIDGCDKNPTAVEHAKEAGADGRFFPLDVLTEPLPLDYDVIMCSLFLHHLDSEQAVELLRHMAGAARRMVLVNDLVRCSAGLLLAYLGTRLLSASPVVHTDGPLSVEAAYTIPEVHDLTRRAGLVGATIGSRWPFRFLLTWRRAE